MGKGGKRKTSFQPGQSGNPKGRPKKPPEAAEVEALARTYSTIAIRALVDIASASRLTKNGRVSAKVPAAARVMAANALLDRGFGKPVQPATSDNVHRYYAISDKPFTREEWIKQFSTYGGPAGGGPGSNPH
jgi:hypothetical protein